MGDMVIAKGYEQRRIMDNSRYRAEDEDKDGAQREAGLRLQVLIVFAWGSHHRKAQSGASTSHCTAPSLRDVFRSSYKSQCSKYRSR